MKRILITGANSYIGVSFETYIREHFPNEYVVDTIDMIDGTWREKSFAGYDAVFHVAGIAHQKETPKNAMLYYKINRDLAIEVAEKAKFDGVKRFIFLSSMSVYGMETGEITAMTTPSPNTHYGRSKLQAEDGISKLSDENFVVFLVRPPIVYGKGCRGNYQSLRKFALKLPFFPCVKNQRSMIYIGNLCEFVRVLSDKETGGIYCPQNAEYVCTSDMVHLIAKLHGRKLRATKLFNWAIWLCMKVRVKYVKKAFGSLTYEKTETIRQVTFEDSIRYTEREDIE